MKNFYKILISFLAAFSIIMPGFATELPKPIVDLIKSQFPKATVRFDGVIELADGTIYLPVLPFNYPNVTDPTAINTTLPEKADITSKPNLILFANDLALLKVINCQDGIRTLLSSPKMPLKVKLGLLPQDLVVPEHLVIPSDLRVIIGDLKIAISDDPQGSMISGSTKAVNPDFKKKPSNSKKTVNVSNDTPEFKDLTNKTFYATSMGSSLLYIIQPQTGKPIKTIKLVSTPFDLQITSDNRYILGSCMSVDSVSIVDTSNDTFVTNIKVGSMPDSIVIPRGSEKAYVANRGSSTISVLDLVNMEVTKTINVTGIPTNLIMSEDQKSLFYVDSVSMKVYQVTPATSTSYLDDAEKKIDRIDPIVQVNNISKIAQFDNYLLILSRTDESLTQYDLTAKKVVKTIKVAAKPVDLKVIKAKNKIYVLSAGTNSIQVVDISSFEVVNKIQLKEGSFYKTVNILPSLTRALVSSVDSYELAIVDLENEKVVDYLPVRTSINSLLLIQHMK